MVSGGEWAWEDDGTHRDLGFAAIGVHFACVVELGDVEPSLGSIHGLLVKLNGPVVLLMVVYGSKTVFAW